MPPLPEFDWKRFNLTSEDDRIKEDPLEPIMTSLQILEDNLKDFRIDEFALLYAMANFTRRQKKFGEINLMNSPEPRRTSPQSKQNLLLQLVYKKQIEEKKISIQYQPSEIDPPEFQNLREGEREEEVTLIEFSAPEQAIIGPNVGSLDMDMDEPMGEPLAHSTTKRARKYSSSSSDNSDSSSEEYAQKRRRIRTQGKLLAEVSRSRNQRKFMQGLIVHQVRQHMTSGRVGGEGHKKEETEKEPVGTRHPLPD